MPLKTEPEPERAGVRIPIEELTPDPRNARVHDRSNIDGIKASLARWGQQRRILIDANNVVVAGNGTVQAARELGWAHIDADITDLEGDEARAYAVADNRLAELASWEDRQLAETLEAIRDAEIDLAAVGYTDAEIDALVAKLGDEILETVGDEEWGDAASRIPSGDKSPFEQMTFTLTEEQAEAVKSALKAAKAVGAFAGTGNENSNGNALARIAESYHGGR